MDNNRKKCIKIDSGTSSLDILRLLDAENSDDDEEIDKLMNDSDTEIFADDETFSNQQHTTAAEDQNLHMYIWRKIHRKIHLPKKVVKQLFGKRKVDETKETHVICKER